MLFKGTARFPKGAIDRLTLEHGGANNAFTWLDYTAYYFAFASDRWEIALDFEADRMRGIEFDADEFAAEKQVVIEELRSGLDGPWDQLEHEVWAAAFHLHPYRNPTVGWLQDVEAATLADMRSYYDTWYHPRNCVLVLVGDLDEDEALRRVEDSFAGIPRGPEPPVLTTSEPPQHGPRRTTVRKPTAVERLLMAWRAPAVAHEDGHALQVVEAALSSGRTSRLYRRLVERDQSVTSVNASFDDHRDPGLFTVRAELKPGAALAAVEAAVHDEIARLRDEGLTPAELARVKQKVRADLVLGSEQYLNQALLLGEYETLLGGAAGGPGYSYLDSLPDCIDAVATSAVQEAIAAYLQMDSSTTGWLVRRDDAGSPVNEAA
jgi:zinc protease